MKTYYNNIISKLEKLNKYKDFESGKGNKDIIKREKGKYGIIYEFINEKLSNHAIIYIQDILYATETVLEYYSECIEKCLKKFIGDITKDARILIVGMGNQFIIADSLGNKIAEKLEPTRHLKLTKEINNIPEISIFLPSVLGVTGIETADSINAICSIVKPTIIIAIDALCATQIDRFCSTVQFSSDGIIPGAGIGNKRKKLEEKNLGAKVVAVGVPLLIKYSTISNSQSKLSSMQEIFTSAEIEQVVDKFAEIISMAISNLMKIN